METSQSYEQLHAQIQAVARARDIATYAAEAKKASFLQWEKENQSMLDYVKAAYEIMDKEESILREMTIAIFHETGDKHPAPEVGIREIEKLEYDPALAFAYAKEHGVALKLDVPSFEKMAKIEELRPAFVSTINVITATIATTIEVEKEKK